VARAEVADAVAVDGSLFAARMDGVALGDVPEADADRPWRREGVERPLVFEDLLAAVGVHRVAKVRRSVAGEEGRIPNLDQAADALRVLPERHSDLPSGAGETHFAERDAADQPSAHAPDGETELEGPGILRHDSDVDLAVVRRAGQDLSALQELQ